MQEQSEHHDHDDAEREQGGDRQHAVGAEQHADAGAQRANGRWHDAPLRGRVAFVRRGTRSHRAHAARDGGGGKRCREREGGREPQRRHAADQADGQRRQRGPYDGDQRIERLRQPHEPLEVHVVVFGDGWQQRVARGHAGDVAHGSQQAQCDEPPEVQSPYHIDNGNERDAGGGYEVGGDGYGAAVEAVERRTAHNADGHLGDGADERQRAGGQRIAGGSQQDERKRDGCDGVSQQGKRVRYEESDGCAAEHEGSFLAGSFDCAPVALRSG